MDMMCMGFLIFSLLRYPMYYRGIFALFSIHLTQKKRWTIELLNYRVVGLSSCQTIELSDYRVVGLSICRTIELSDYRTIKLSDYRVIGLSSRLKIEISDFRIFGLPSCRSIKLDIHPCKYCWILSAIWRFVLTCFFLNMTVQVVTNLESN